MRFAFDERKSRGNLVKHGINFEMIAVVFDDPIALTLQDEVHSADEERWITQGEVGPGAVVFVAHTSFSDESGEEVVRLVSARAATRRERRAYEEAHARAEAAGRDDGGEGRR